MDSGLVLQEEAMPEEASASTLVLPELKRPGSSAAQQARSRPGMGPKCPPEYYEGH